jgi:uridylate kinase
MKVVVSIGGSVLAPDEGPSRVSDHAAVIEQLDTEGCTVAAVVGGGTVAREYIATARDLGANEMALDEIGIATTRLNARLLIAALGEQAVQEPPEDYESAGAALRRGEIPVMGGVAPAQTTDAVSAALAEYVNADLLVYATSVPGVFTANPDDDPDAERLPTLSAEELLDVISDIEMTAGSSAPVDILAAKVIQRSGMRAIVLDGTEPDRILDAVRYGTHDGTDIVPAGGGGDEPTDWAQEDEDG